MHTKAAKKMRNSKPYWSKELKNSWSIMKKNFKISEGIKIAKIDLIGNLFGKNTFCSFIEMSKASDCV